MTEAFEHHVHELDDLLSTAAIQESEHDGSAELTVGFSRGVLPSLAVHFSIQYPSKNIKINKFGTKSLTFSRVQEYFQ